jgi:hypothetical protein
MHSAYLALSKRLESALLKSIDTESRSSIDMRETEWADLGNNNYCSDLPRQDVLRTPCQT